MAVPEAIGGGDAERFGLGRLVGVVDRAGDRRHPFQGDLQQGVDGIAAAAVAIAVAPVQLIDRLGPGIRGQHAPAQPVTDLEPALLLVFPGFQQQRAETGVAAPGHVPQ